MKALALLFCLLSFNAVAAPKEDVYKHVPVYAYKGDEGTLERDGEWIYKVGNPENVFVYCVKDPEPAVTLECLLHTAHDDLQLITVLRTEYET